MTMISGTDNRLTPDAVQADTFPPARPGRRGLDKAHVRAFCRQVEREMVRLLNERAALTDEVQRLRRRVLGLGRDGSGSGYRPDDVPVQVARILLSKAQQTADHCVADAQEYGRQLARDAWRRRDEIRAEATSHAALMLEQAHAEASRAAEAALAFPVTRATTDRGEPEAELAYLRTFSDVYRRHLHASLDAMVCNVAGWERAEQTSLAAASADLPRLPHYPQPPAPTG
jgi:cell division septum initiation protein DivIVA